MRTKKTHTGFFGGNTNLQYSPPRNLSVSQSPALKHIVTKEELNELRKKQTDRFFESRKTH